MKKSFVSMLAVSIVASGLARLIRLDSRGEDDEVSLDLQLLVHDEVGAPGRSSFLPSGRDLADLTLDVVDAVLLDGSAVELVEVLAGRTARRCRIHKLRCPGTCRG